MVTNTDNNTGDIVTVIITLDLACKQPLFNSDSNIYTVKHFLYVKVFLLKMFY